MAVCNSATIIGSGAREVISQATAMSCIQPPSKIAMLPIMRMRNAGCFNGAHTDFGGALPLSGIDVASGLVTMFSIEWLVCLQIVRFELKPVHFEVGIRVREYANEYRAVLVVFCAEVCKKLICFLVTHEIDVL